MTYLEQLFGVAQKTSLVTGGATGIGRMIAEALVQGGAKVLIASRKGEDCEAAAAEINALDAPGEAVGFAGDVSTEDGINALVAEVKQRTETLNILVNNAGVTWGEPFETFPHAAWEKVMNVNVAGLFTLTRNLTPMLEAAASDEDPSRIINLGSIMGTKPIADMAFSYAASKAAVHHLTEIFANDLASRRITCNAFAPGPFRSRMTAFATSDEGKAAAMAATIPLGRLGEPSDIAAATLFLCGKGGSYVTGAILPVDGGMKAQADSMLFPRGRS
ncbi:SDR family oxidoreductase [Rhodobacteraceae bacterium NNCM2]|nr:SDR family oxidoreductase [Coraliihabitans acroporae]